MRKLPPGCGRIASGFPLGRAGGSSDPRGPRARSARVRRGPPVRGRASGRAHPPRGPARRRGRQRAAEVSGGAGPAFPLDSYLGAPGAFAADDPFAMHGRHARGARTGGAAPRLDRQRVFGSRRGRSHSLLRRRRSRARRCAWRPREPSVRPRSPRWRKAWSEAGSRLSCSSPKPARRSNARTRGSSRSCLRTARLRRRRRPRKLSGTGRSRGSSPKSPAGPDPGLSRTPPSPPPTLLRTTGAATGACTTKRYWWDFSVPHDGERRTFEEPPLRSRILRPQRTVSEKGKLEGTAGRLPARRARKDREECGPGSYQDDGRCGKLGMADAAGPPLPQSIPSSPLSI